MRAAIVATLVLSSIALFGASANADEYATAATRCAKESPGNFAAQMACIQRERTEPSRYDSEPERKAEFRSINRRERIESLRTLEN